MLRRSCIRALCAARTQPVLLRHASRMSSGAVDILDPLACLTDTQKALYETADAFAREHMHPFAGEWDAKHIFPEDTLRRMGEMGFGGMNVREDVGGCALTRADTVAILEALSRGCVSTTAYVSIHNMCARMLDLHAPAALRAELVPQLCRFDKFASYCLTEPNAGSDAASLRTRAEYDAATDTYYLSGSKAFISGGGRSDVYIVMARHVRDGRSTPGSRGVTAFLVRAGARGLSFGAAERKMGWNSQPTAAVYLDRVPVPAAERVGVEGGGFGLALQALDGGRLSIAACSLGAAAEATTRALAHAHTREQFGAPIAANQAVAFMLSAAATRVHTSRLTLQHAARLLDTGAPSASAHAALAKAFVTQSCFDAVSDALQCHGGYGYLKDYPLERYLRDLRVHMILEGTNQIMNVIVARALAAPFAATATKDSKTT